MFLRLWSQSGSVKGQEELKGGITTVTPPPPQANTAAPGYVDTGFEKDI